MKTHKTKQTTHNTKEVKQNKQTKKWRKNHYNVYYVIKINVPFFHNNFVPGWFDSVEMLVSENGENYYFQRQRTWDDQSRHLT